MHKSTTILSLTEFTLSGSRFVFDQFVDHKIERKRFEIQDKSFTLSAGNNKYCLGRYDLATFESFPCPHFTDLTGKKEKICYSCFQFNGFNPSFYNVPTSTLSTKQREYNRCPHVVYLSAFSNDGIKVGISNKHRVETRWCEQGALAAAIIAEVADAYDARELEEAINKKCSLPDNFKKQNKRDLLRQVHSFDSMAGKIKSVYALIQEKISMQAVPLAIVDLNKKYFGNIPFDSSFVDLTGETIPIISGSCQGVIGDTLLMLNKGVQLAISLSKFIGHSITLEDRVIPIDFKPVQQQLF